MRQINITQYEKVAMSDINSLQFALSKDLADDVLYPFFGYNNGVLDGLAGSYVSALASSIAIGHGFIYDGTQTGLNPKYRMISVASPVAVTHSAADPTNPRYDLVCLAPNFVVTATASRFIKTGGVGPVALQTVNKNYADTYTLQVVAGTPAGSPAVPATPAGYIPLYTALISASTGMSGSGAISDARFMLYGNPKPFNRKRSVSSGVFSTTSTTLTDVTNLTVTLQSFGRPVMVMLVSDGSGSPSSLSASASGAPTLAEMLLSIQRGSGGFASIADFKFTGPINSSAAVARWGAASISFVDEPAAGIYTYKAQIAVGPSANGTTPTATVSNVKLIAFEI